MKVAGFVLTGGQSSRMGRDKALLSVAGLTLCEQVARSLRNVADKVFLVGRPERYRHLPYECLPDHRPDLGPLSGIETALRVKAERHLITGCDAFGLKPYWLQSLLIAATRIDSNRHLCIVAEDSAGKLQPLCAIYRSAGLPIISKALDERRLRLLDVMNELNPYRVKLDGMLENINTPEQYERL